LHEHSEEQHNSNKALVHYLSLTLRQAKLIAPENSHLEFISTRNSHPEFISGSLLY